MLSLKIAPGGAFIRWLWLPAFANQLTSRFKGLIDFLIHPCVCVSSSLLVALKTTGNFAPIAILA